jgi:hypothetical protein
VARRSRAERFYARGALQEFRAARSTRTLDNVDTVRTYYGSAKRAPSHNDGYTSLDRRPFLLYLREDIPGDHDDARARREVERRGWAEVELERGGRVIAAARLYMESEDVRTCYFEAAALGSTFRSYWREVLHVV